MATKAIARQVHGDYVVCTQQFCGDNGDYVVMAVVAGAVGRETAAVVAVVQAKSARGRGAQGSDSHCLAAMTSCRRWLLVMVSYGEGG